MHVVTSCFTYAYLHVTTICKLTVGKPFPRRPVSMILSHQRSVFHKRIPVIPINFPNLINIILIFVARGLVERTRNIKYTHSISGHIDIE